MLRARLQIGGRSTRREIFQDGVGLRIPSKTMGFGTVVFDIAASAARWCTPFAGGDRQQGRLLFLVVEPGHAIGVGERQTSKCFDIFRREQDPSMDRVFIISTDRLSGG